MRRGQGKLILIVILTILLAGYILFVRDRASQDFTKEELWPLSEGNAWRYQVDGRAGEDEVVVSVVDSAGTRQEKSYRVEFDYGSHTTYEYYTYGDDGLLWYRLDNPLGSYERSPEQLLVKHPAGERHEWDWEGELRPISGEEISFQGSADMTQTEFTTVELPFGQHQGVQVTTELTLKIHGEISEIEDVRTYVPEIGLVKQEVREEGELTLQKLLTDYQLGNNTN